ncbi:hypothetical protein BN1088_1431556 [Sphingobacterium sp. PM2-P1-29]|nr:hypothetical protein BN1088_1431556 [Sphingobacterium sp. PM2-P1-29]
MFRYGNYFAFNEKFNVTDSIYTYLRKYQQETITIISLNSLFLIKNISNNMPVLKIIHDGFAYHLCKMLK